jgi:putative transposase
MIQQHPHRPTHLFLDEHAYFITGAIYQKRPLLQDTAIKQMLFQSIQNSFAKYGWSLEHWVILDNHYHLLCKSKYGKDLPALMKNIHGTTATSIATTTSCEKPVWYNYWDYCPRNEHEYYTRLNYLLNNPIKHGYVENLHDYAFSSFHALFKELGREHLAEQFRTYPTITTLEEAEYDDF